MTDICGMEKAGHISNSKLFGLYIGLVDAENFSNQVEKSTRNKYGRPLSKIQFFHNPKHWQ